MAVPEGQWPAGHLLEPLLLVHDVQRPDCQPQGFEQVSDAGLAALLLLLATACGVSLLELAAQGCAAFSWGHLRRGNRHLWWQVLLCIQQGLQHVRQD